MASLKNVKFSLSLIFWGILVCAIDARAGEFDIINDFVGMLMILAGITTFPRDPLPDRYKRWMTVVVIITVLTAISTFFLEILTPLCLMQMPKPNTIVGAVFRFWTLIFILGFIAFCRCMAEYCSVMNWGRALASWKFSTSLMTYGVMPSCVMFAIAVSVAFPSLEFYPDLSRANSQGQSLIGDDCQFTASRKGKIIYTETVSRSPDGMFHFKHPKLAPSALGSQTLGKINLFPASVDKTTIKFGHWIAPVKGMPAKVVSLLLVPVAFVFAWAIIHFLMSLSRMTRAVEQAITISRVEETGEVD